MQARASICLQAHASICLQAHASPCLQAHASRCLQAHASICLQAHASRCLQAHASHADVRCPAVAPARAQRYDERLADPFPPQPSAVSNLWMPTAPPSDAHHPRSGR